MKIVNTALYVFRSVLRDHAVFFKSEVRNTDIREIYLYATSFLQLQSVVSEI
jgi:beta-N-acetylglucosaminidase